MSEAVRWMPTALVSARRVQPAAFAAVRTVGESAGGGPSPKPTLEPLRNFEGSIDLIVSWSPEDPGGTVAVFCETVEPLVVSVAGAGAAVSLEPPLLEPQPARSSAPASSANPRRALTPRTLEAPC